MYSVQQELAVLIRAKTQVSPQLDDGFAVLNIDSLAMAELTIEIERAFNIRVDEEILDAETFGDLVRYVEHRGGTPQASPRVPE